MSKPARKKSKPLPLLTAERVRELLEYNPDTGSLIWKVTRGLGRKGSRAGTVSTSTTVGGQYYSVFIDYRPYRAHRLAWLHFYGSWPDSQIDHIDGDGLNNRLSNLRAATNVENARHRGRSSANTSGFKGVSLNKKRWQAAITVNGKTMFLGRFSDPALAHAAYVAAAQKYFGEFSRAE